MTSTWKNLTLKVYISYILSCLLGTKWVFSSVINGEMFPVLIRENKTNNLKVKLWDANSGVSCQAVRIMPGTHLRHCINSFLLIFR